MYATVLVVANLKMKSLPSSRSDALEVEAHDLAKAGKRNVGNSVKPDADLSTGPR